MKYFKVQICKTCKTDMKSSQICLESIAQFLSPFPTAGAGQGDPWSQLRLSLDEAVNVTSQHCKRNLERVEFITSFDVHSTVWCHSDLKNAFLIQKPMGYLGFVERATPPFYSFHVSICNTSTQRVDIDCKMAKLRISHLSDSLCMQLHLSCTPRIPCLHTNGLCRLFHSVLCKILHCMAVKYRKNY